MSKMKLFAWWYPHDPAYKEYKLVRHRGSWKLKSIKDGFLKDCVHYSTEFKREVAEDILLGSGWHEVK